MKKLLFLMILLANSVHAENLRKVDKDTSVNEYMLKKGGCLPYKSRKASKK